MQDVVFYSLSFQNLNHNLITVGDEYRLEADGNYFYFSRSQFEDIDIIQKQRAGDEIFVGAHRLKNGSYWLHWLHSQRDGTLESNWLKNFYSDKFCALGIVGVAFFFLALLINSTGNANYGTAIFYVVSYVVLFLLYTFGRRIWARTFSWRSIKLALMLRAVKKGNYSQFKKPTPILAKQTTSEKNDLEALNESVATVDNTVLSAAEQTLENYNHVDRIYYRHTGRYSGENSVMNYSVLFINPKEANFVVDYRKLKGVFKRVFHNVEPMMRKTPPLFLAKHDHLYLLIEQYNHGVLGIYNNTAQAAYVKCDNEVASDRFTIKAVIGVLAIMVACYWLLTRSVYFSGMNLSDSVGLFLVLALHFCCLSPFVVGALFNRLFSSRAKKNRQARKILKHWGKMQNKPVVIQEFMGSGSQGYFS